MASTGVLMGVDPGPRPGLALKIATSYHTMWLQTPDELYKLIHDHRPDWVALELFARSNRIDRNMIETMQCVGGVQGVCAANSIILYSQRPQERRSFIRDAQQHLVPGHAPHERDALAHLLLREHMLKHGRLNL